MKIKSAALFLMIGSCAWMVTIIYYLFLKISHSGLQVSVVFNILDMLLPVGLFLFGYAVYNKKIKQLQDPDTGTDTQASALEYAPESPTVANWIGDFIVAAIRVVGLICLIVWARDKERPVRKSWASAVLLMSGIVLVATIVYYAVRLNSYYY